MANTFYWTNDDPANTGGSLGVQPATAVTLPVTGGLYSVVLGDPSLTNMVAIPPAAFQHPAVFLRVWFDDGVHGFQMLTPDQPLSTVPYAFLAGGVPDGSVSATQLADGAVTSSKLGAGAITPDKLFSGAAPVAGQIPRFDGTKFEWTTQSSTLPLPYSASLSSSGTPLFAITNTAVGGTAVTGESYISNIAAGGIGVLGKVSSLAGGTGVQGYSAGIGNGVEGIAVAGDGVIGRTGAQGQSGVIGYATLANSTGVHGTSKLHHGVYAFTESTDRAALWAQAPNGAEAIHAHSVGGDALVGYTSGAGKAGIWAWTDKPGSRGAYIANTAGGYALTTFGKAEIGGDLNVYGTASVKVLTITGGADVAEPFAMAEKEELPKGSVVAIDASHPGRLRQSDREYDTCVAGIVSGANGINPGLSLSQEGVNENGQHVALTGRVYCLADASQGAIRPGDLLTTSGTPGHAMKVRDPARAQGAVLGKAMSALEDGKGFVLVLVTLQ